MTTLFFHGLAELVVFSTKGYSPISKVPFSFIRFHFSDEFVFVNSYPHFKAFLLFLQLSFFYVKEYFENNTGKYKLKTKLFVYWKYEEELCSTEVRRNINAIGVEGNWRSL